MKGLKVVIESKIAIIDQQKQTIADQDKQIVKSEPLLPTWAVIVIAAGAGLLGGRLILGGGK